MRTPNKLIVGLMGVGVMAAAYKTGLTTAAQAATDLGAPLAPQTDDQTTTPTATPSATPSASTPTRSNGGTTTPTRPSANGGTSGGTTGGTTTPVDPGTTTPVDPGTTTTTPTTGGSKTGAAIGYRFGTIQVSVTKSNGSITAIDLVQAGATGGRQTAFPRLVAEAINANGSSFGNLGGATYTTAAFKQALDSALAKF